MSEVTIANIAGGEDTSPANTSKIEIEVGGVSKFAQLVNILKNAIPIGGTTPAAGAFTTLKQTTGKAAGAIPISDVNGNLTLTASTGSGAPVRAGAPTLTGQATIPTVNLTGGQIAFPATAVPSADANTLDDYEEGTWTPVVVGATTAGTGTYTAQVGYYTKIGNIVYIQAYVGITAHTGAGNMSISGLPFSGKAVTGDATLAVGYCRNLTLTANNILTLFIGASSSSVSAYQYPAGGGGSTPVTMDTSYILEFGGTYLH